MSYAIHFWGIQIPQDVKPMEKVHLKKNIAKLRGVFLYEWEHYILTGFPSVGKIHFYIKFLKNKFP